ncbi:hypothetical protein G8S49_11315 [Clostridium botulinum C]|uniref:Uncharacterized protein n=1 Tax=Clostridium botulinum C TaxID=36828 RepID=A0A9Q3VAL4_CLOBO|nr:hypothetical protein [Clostridium botulinum]MCD3195742.1 hypothetical protein [Clostridium botulinum C]MCD3201158.1 hypothetical protein [Clostridium botulinum C]MCD3207114.1 hypothetical protein [Clostridium botulinum C]MCD3209693.1 hypothetical protein [Clostridium botulinum C]MCD3226543.1 hypothetical protein [Clostridium botulinum C]
MNSSTMKVEFLKDTNIPKELEKLEKEGWRVVAGEPIEKIVIHIIGQKFTLEKWCDTQK